MTLAELSLLMQLVVSGGGELNTGQIDQGFLWERYPNGTCMRIDVSKFAQIPKVSAWINAYDNVDMVRLYFVKQGWITYRLDPNDPLCRAVNGTDTSKLYAVAVPPPVVTPPPTSITTPAGTLTDAGGGIWTFGAQTSTGGNVLMLNGTATTGFGKTLSLVNGKIYTQTVDGKSFVWTGTNWLSGTP